MFNSYDPETCCGGVAYNISNVTKRPNNITNYHADFGRVFNNSKNIRQSNRFIENRWDYGYGQTTQIHPEGYPRVDHSYVSVSGGSGITDNSGYPQFDRELSYYGPFYDVDRCDTATRREEKQNTTRGNNGS